MSPIESLEDLNFFLVGAPKCGTTSMHEHLKGHPQVFLANVKELHYFGSDLGMSRPSGNFFNVPRTTGDRQRYLSYFSECSDETVRGESSVFYLYSERAASEIRQECKNARILIMLRNPVDMLYSLHSQYLYGGNEDVRDFEGALELERYRRDGHHIPKKSHFPSGLQYRKIADYLPQLQRFISIFGRENVHITVFEKFVRDNEIECKKIFKFLEITENFVPDFRVINSNKQVWNSHLQRLLQFPPEGLSGISHVFPRAIRRSIRSRLMRLNRRDIKRKPLPVAIRERLRNEAVPSFETLSEIVGVDLCEEWRR